jgi:hypothetical protein
MGRDMRCIDVDLGCLGTGLFRRYAMAVKAAWALGVLDGIGVRSLLTFVMFG